MDYNVKKLVGNNWITSAIPFLRKGDVVNINGIDCVCLSDPYKERGEYLIDLRGNLIKSGNEPPTIVT